MKTEVALAEALKSLMSKESLDNITVKRLVDMCGVKRQTFYYHFRDIYDLLTWIFLNDQIGDPKAISSWQEAIKTVTKYVLKNKRFVKNTLSSAGKDLFEQFVESFLYAFTLHQFVKYDLKSKVPSEDKRFYCAYYVAGISKSIINWINNGMKESEEVVIKHLTNVVGDFIEGVIKIY